MRIVQIITATSIAFGSATTAFAASPLSTPAYTAQFIQGDAGAAEIVLASERGHKAKKHKKNHHAERRVRENREARRERQHGHHHNNGRYNHTHDDSDLDKVLGVLGAAAVISNLD